MAKNNDTIEHETLLKIGNLLYQSKIIPAPPMSLAETERLRDQELTARANEQKRMKVLLDEIKIENGLVAINQLLEKKHH